MVVGLAAGASAPAANLKEFVARTKTNPDKYSYSSAGPGSPPHLVAELLKRKTGAQVLHLPYKGTGAALPDLVGGPPEAFAGCMNAEFKRWGEVVRTANIKVE